MSLELATINISEVITMTIIHSLWQAPLVALIMYVMLRRKNHTSSNYKYNIALSALCLIAITTMFTAIFYIGQQYVQSGVSFTQRIDSSTSYLGNTTTITSNSSLGLWEQIMQFEQRITICWLVGAGLFLLRYLIGFGGLLQIRRSLDFDIPQWVHQTYDRIDIATDRVVRIAQSRLIESPMMIGYLKPIIIFPMATINQLSSAEVEAIIIHEIGHILRNDFIHNLIIVVIESLLFYNPAIWWICKILKEERENACDDLVLQQGLSGMSYVKTLLKLQELSKTNNNQLAINLFTKKSSLMNRIKRILNQPVRLSYFKERGISIILILIGILTLTSAKVITPSLEELNPIKTLALTPFNNLITDHHELPRQFIKPILIIDTIPNESENSERYEWKEEKLEELKEKEKEVYERYKSQIKSLEKELQLNTEDYDEVMEQKIEELNEHIREHYDANRWEAFGERFGKEFGERFSMEMEDTFSEEWIEEMEALGERLEREMGDMSDEIDVVINEEWLSEIAEMGQEISAVVVEALDEEMLEDMTEMSLAIASEAMEGVSEALAEIDFDHHYDTDLKTRLAEELYDDGYWNEGKKNSLVITNDYMKANGDKVDSQTLKKYQRIIKSNIENAFDGKTKISYKLKGNNKSSFNISVSR